MVLNDREINENKIVNSIRALSIDMINNAKSGHPGICLSAAPIIYTIYSRHLVFDPNNPNYINRDRFIMSAGHGSALLYSTLYMSGFDIDLEDLKEFRKLDSKTPGHPEYRKTPGVDMTTGPLGQGIASAVGIAIAERYLNAYFNKYQKDLINHYTYVLCGDGDLQEGISYEALSLAGLYKLNKLIVLYDSNDMTLDGKKELTSIEDTKLRFESIGWNYLKVNDSEDINELNNSIELAKLQDKPTIIEVKTKIGAHSPLEGTNKVHGTPLSEEDTIKLKEKLDIRPIPFTISASVKEDMQLIINSRNKNISEKFYNKLDDNLKDKINFLENDNKKLEISELNFNLDETTNMSLREISGLVLNDIVKSNDFIIGGSADVASPTKTLIKDVGVFNKDNYLGKNIYYGVREHAMGAISNGIALHGLIPFCSTFLTFSDYLKPSIRLAAMMNLKVLYIFTHDSISVGQDGPTHQPIEQISSLYSTPNIDTYRPADINELIGSYKLFKEKDTGPISILVSRNKLPVYKLSSINNIEKGGYILKDFESNKNLILISSGEDLKITMEVSDELQRKGIDSRVVSIPNINKFINQPNEYINEILPLEVKKIVISTNSSSLWYSLVYNNNCILALDEYGLSAPPDDVYKKLGFDKETLVNRIESIIK